MSAKAAATAAAAAHKCVEAPLKAGWQYFTMASGSSAGALSALTGLGGAVVFVPACSHLGMTAKKIVGTTVVAVTCATTAGSIAYTQNNVTDIPAAMAVGVVGAATTPLGQMVARGVSGKVLRKWCGAALLACAPTAFMTKSKEAPEEDGGEERKPVPVPETRPGGNAALALSGKADELVSSGGILAYLNRSNRGKPAVATSPAEGEVKPKVSSPAEGSAVAGEGGEPERGQSGSAITNFKEQFQERIERAGGVYEAIWAEREHLLLGLAVGMLQGTVGVGGGVLVTTYMSIMSDMEVHRICATALLATLVTNTAVCAHHFSAGNVRPRVAAVLGCSAMAASYITAKTISLSVPEEGIRGFIFTALVASGISMLK